MNKKKHSGAFKNSKLFIEMTDYLLSIGHTKSGIMTKIYRYKRLWGAPDIEEFKKWVGKHSNPNTIGRNLVAEHYGRKTSPVKCVETLSQENPIKNDIINPDATNGFMSNLSELSKTILRSKANKENTTVYMICANIVNDKCNQLLEELL